MELVVLENIHKFSWNFDALKADLQQHIQKYNGLVVTEQNLKDMEKTQKEIASLRTKIEAFRKTVKKEMEEPYRVFEYQVKELRGIIDEAETPIKDQLAIYEAQRIEKCKSELIAYAKEIAVGMGLREENFRLSILARWTNRTAKKNETRQEICAELERMCKEQELTDAAEALAKQKTELIEQLCASTSELYSLSTPVTPREVTYLTRDAGIAEIPEIIKRHCKDRAEVELKAAKEAEAIAEAKALVETQAREAAAAKAAEPPVKPEPIVQRAQGPVRWNLTLEFRGLTTEQAVELCNYIKAQGIAFATLGKEKIAS